MDIREIRIVVVFDWWWSEMVEKQCVVGGGK